MFLTLARVLGVDVLALRGFASEVEDHLWPAYEYTGDSRFGLPPPPDWLEPEKGGQHVPKADRTDRARGDRLRLRHA
jgi:hypothetical protein